MPMIGVLGERAVGQRWDTPPTRKYECGAKHEGLAKAYLEKGL